MDRRKFLQAAGFLTVGTIAGPALAEDDDRETEEERRHRPPAGTYKFGAGVASGDPRPFSVVFWTRVERTDGAGEDVRLWLEVAHDEDFRRLVWRRRLVAQTRWDNTLRHKLIGLLPQRTYYYRFVAGRDASPIGRTRTAPLPFGRQPEQVRFAYLTCQDWNANHWQTIERLAEEDVDFVVHLGDYIYEDVPTRTAPVEAAHGPLTLPDGARTPNADSIHAVSLADYRYLYRAYRSDPRLQKLHARHPVIAIWDDHEFTNDAWQSHQTYTNANIAEPDRRRAANQAWFENMPADVPFDADDPSFTNIRIYRDFEFGALVHLIMTDERLYRSDHVIPEPLAALATGADPVNGDSQIGSRYFVDKALLAGAEAQLIAAGQSPTVLGAPQVQWWKDRMSKSRAAWRVWGNEVSLLRMQLDLRRLAPPPFNKVFLLNADQWDGYNAARKELMGFLKAQAVQNVVAITGDIHAFFAGTVFDDYDAAQPVPVMVDLVTAGASSTPLFEAFKAGVDADPVLAALRPLIYVEPVPGTIINTFNGTLKAFNPWIGLADTSAIGYVVVTATREQLRAEFKKFLEVDRVGNVPVPTLASVTQLTVASGVPAVQVTPLCTSPETCA